MTDESYPEGFDTDPTSPGFMPGEEVEVVPLDEPSIEDYPAALTRCWCIDGDTCTRDGVALPGEFCFKAQQKPVPVHDGVRDTKNR